MVRMIGNEPRVEIIHEAIRPIVEGQPEDRHVVGIHDPMRPAHGLPSGNQPAGAFGYLTQESRVGIRTVDKMRKMPGQDVIRQGLEVIVLTTVKENFERPEADVTRGHAHEHRAGFHAFPQHGFIAADETQGPGRRDAQAVHGLTAQVFPDRRTQHRPAVPVP